MAGDEADWAEQLAAAYEQGLKLLVRREHSRRELARKLGDRDHPAAAVEAALDRLEAENALNDGRFAEEYARARFAGGFGPVRVAAELREHGIDGDGLRWARLGRDEEHELAAAQLAKRFGSGAPRDFKERAKRMRYLQRRGFAPEVCARVVPEAGRDGGNPEDPAAL
ncbi:MAG TPA: regulatory protein RecX [Gammaproteobacteria bacterium]|nr:regulatory protein RecX [Gammaproteobacteria bacterium]